MDFITGNNIIEIKNLFKSFSDNLVLKDINLNVPENSIISVIGRSGCGKTTLLRCINCLEKFDSGELTVNGIQIVQSENSANQKSKKKNKKNDKDNLLKMEEVPDPEYKQKAYQIRDEVGMLFQTLDLFPHLNVMNNVAIAPKIVKKLDEFTVNNKALSALEKVGMEYYSDRYPHQLSGGQKQRVAIARALALNPKVMLYDEPTSALDPELIQGISDLIVKLKKEGMTQIIVTHSMYIAKTISDYVVFMDKGKIIEMGTPKELFENPKHDAIKNYLSLIIE